MERRLNHLVEGGVISQKEADAVLAWHGEMPQALKDLMAQRMHRSPDSKSQGRVRPSQRFQGQDMDRSRPESRRVDLEGFTERDIRRPGARSERRNNVPEAAIEGGRRPGPGWPALAALRPTTQSHLCLKVALKFRLIQ